MKIAFLNSSDYRMKGYDDEGRPTRAKLQELNIEWVADKLNLK